LPARKDELVADFLTLCEQAARAGGQALLDRLGTAKVREKGPSDLVTEADWASQEAIRDILLSAYPEYGFLSEESEITVNPAAEHCWVVDPLDGTTNFVHQVPHYAVSIALVRGGRPIAGVIFDPTHGELFSASIGKGAWLNGQQIHTSSLRDLSEALVAASFSAKVLEDSPEIPQFLAVLLRCQAVRRTGSAALNLAYVAAGRFDGFWAMTTKAWDVAAGVLLVEEAGGTVTALEGGAFDLKTPHPIASANPELHARLEKLLTDATRRSTD
jgi:myo-inositol-1(or 4)-monophosphatase